MSHPHERLDRHVIGQGLGVVAPKTQRLFEREARSCGPVIELPEPRASRGGQVRLARPRVEAGPNSPLLVRLIRHPYALDTVGFKHQSLPARGVTLREARRGYREELETALRAPRLEPWARPTDCRFRWEPRTRPTVSDWLKNEADPE